MRAADVETITNVTMKTQTIWRQRGYLKANDEGKRANFSVEEIFRVLIIDAMRELPIDLAPTAHMFEELANVAYKFGVEGENASRFTVITKDIISDLVPPLENQQVLYCFYHADDPFWSRDQHVKNDVGASLIIDNEMIWRRFRKGVARLIPEKRKLLEEIKAKKQTEIRP